MSNRPQRSIRQIIDEQVARWSVERGRGGPAAGLRVWPLITVSREYGSQGAEVGRQAAERLGFDLWDKQIVQAVAEDTGTEEALLATLDERARSALEEFVANALPGPPESEREYVRHVARIVHTLNEHGRAVVVGRGAQYVLDPRRTLRVRVVCPFEVRVERMASRRGLAPHEAEREVRRVEKERHAFIRRHYQQDSADIGAYDLVISTEQIGPAQAADVVVAAYKAKFGRLPS